jgi:hypothetical protein
MSEPVITLTKEQAAEVLDILENLACHSLTCWEDGIDEYFTQKEFDELKERFVKVTQSVGGTRNYEEMSARVR